MPRVTESLRQQWMNQRAQDLEEREFTQSGEPRHPESIAEVDFGLAVLDRLLALPLGAQFDAQQIQAEMLSQPAPKEATMATTVNDVERAEMMLSLNMNESGEPLSEGEKAELEAFVAANAGLKDEGSAMKGEAENYGNPTGELTGPPSEVTNPTVGYTTAPGPQPAPQPQPQGGDLQSMIQNAVNTALGGVLGGAAAGPQSLEEILKNVDPRDSESALAMFDWLVTNSRLQNIGTINGGGYLWHYQEPKGASNEGYTPGKTQGGRMVDSAIEQAKAAGAKPREVSMCEKCFSAVERQPDGTVHLDGDPTGTTCAANGGGPHVYHTS